MHMGVTVQEGAPGIPCNNKQQILYLPFALSGKVWLLQKQVLIVPSHLPAAPAKQLRRTAADGCPLCCLQAVPVTL